jgi:hypothetical protein
MAATASTPVLSHAEYVRESIGTWNAALLPIDQDFGLEVLTTVDYTSDSHLVPAFPAEIAVRRKAVWCML